MTAALTSETVGTSALVQFRASVFIPLKSLSLFAARFKLRMNLMLYNQYTRVCGCLCVFACVYALRIVSTDKNLCFINALFYFLISFIWMALGVLTSLNMCDSLSLLIWTLVAQCSCTQWLAFRDQAFQLLCSFSS